MKNIDSLQSSDITSVPHISVVVPVYKADHILDELYRRIKAALETISADFEIVFVEDCGGDNSWQVICQRKGQDGVGVRVLFSASYVRDCISHQATCRRNICMTKDHNFAAMQNGVTSPT